MAAMDVSSLLPLLSVEDLLDEDMLREKSSSEDSLVVVVSFLLLDGGV